MSDIEAVEAAVLGETEPLDRLAASLYNKPAVPSFSRPTSSRESRYFEPVGDGGTHFLRWHELSADQKDKVRASLSERLGEIGVVLEGLAERLEKDYPLAEAREFNDWLARRGLTVAEVQATLSASEGMADLPTEGDR